jgi:outer membrane lipoprotein SlyB
MEAIKPRLHPLLTAAAISVTVFSAVGVATLTGLIPTSKGQTQEAAAPVAATAPAEMPAAQPAAEPAPAPAAPKPVAKKKPVQHVAAAKATQPVTYPDYAQLPPPPPVAQAQAPQPAPVALNVGTVESVREVSVPSDGRSGVGAIGGGIAGAVLGNQVGHGMGRNIATVLGAGVGAFAGKEIEKQVNTKKRWDITVRMDNGNYQTVSSNTEPFWHAGDRVRLVDGRLQPV